VATVETRRTEKPPITRLAFSKREAAEAIGCSVDFLEEHVWPDLKVILQSRVPMHTEPRR